MNKLARAILLVFAILAVAGIIYSWKKQDQAKALKALLETYQVRIDKHGDDLFVIANHPDFVDLKKLASLMHRAKTLADGTPLIPTGIDVTGSANLKSLDGAYQMQELKSVIASDCPQLESLNGINGLTKLNDLSIGYNGMLKDVSAIDGLKSLITIDLTSSHQLEELSIGNPKNLKNLYLSDCPKITQLDLSQFTELHQLSLDSCRRLSELTGLSKLSKLTDLDLSNCHKLKNIDGFNELKSLVVFDIRNLELDDFSIVGELPNLQMIRLGGQANITNLTPFSKLKKLEEIHLEACPNLESLEGMPSSVSRYAGFVRCPKLTSLSGVKNARKNLLQLDLTESSAIEDIEELKTLTKLNFISFAGCRKITSIDQLIHNPELKIVRLGGSGVTPTSIGTTVTVGPKKGTIMLKKPLTEVFSTDVTIFDFTNSE